MSAVPAAARDLKPRLGKFAEWLTARGASLLDPTNEWELLRFKAGAATAVIYTNKTGRLTFTGEAKPALEAFVRNGSWRAAPATRRTKKANGPIYQALRRRDGDACFFCLCDVDEDEESIEHLVSATHGGPNHIANFVLAHRQCNAEAGHLSAVEKIARHVAAHVAKLAGGEEPPAACGLHYVGGLRSRWQCDTCGYDGVHDAHPGCRHKP